MIHEENTKRFFGNTALNKQQFIVVVPYRELGIHFRDRFDQEVWYMIYRIHIYKALNNIVTSQLQTEKPFNQLTQALSRVNDRF